MEESLHNVVWNENEAKTGITVQMDNRGTRIDREREVLGDQQDNEN